MQGPDIQAGFPSILLCFSRQVHAMGENVQDFLGRSNPMMTESVRLRLVGIGNNVFPGRSGVLGVPHLLRQYVILHDMCLCMHILPSANLIPTE